MKCKQCGNPKHYAKRLCRSCWKKQRYHANPQKAQEQSHKWKQQNKQHIKEYTKQYWNKNKERQNAKRRGNPIILNKRQKYYREHREQELASKKKYDATHKEQIRKYTKVHYWRNPELMRQKARSWIKNNLKRKLEYNKNYYYTNYANDTLFKLQRAIRKDLIKALTKNKLTKENKTFLLLGYNVKQLKEHLENQFDSNMNWKNYGKYWHIDHVNPISWAKTKEEIIKFNQLENLQPLEAKQNLKKNNRYSGKLPNNTI